MRLKVYISNQSVLQLMNDEFLSEPSEENDEIEVRESEKEIFVVVVATQLAATKFSFSLLSTPFSCRSAEGRVSIK